MTIRKIRIFPPRLPHPDTLADPRYSIADREQTWLVVYCPRNQVGGLYHVEHGLWTLQGPVTAAEFLAALQRRGIELAECEDLQTWLDAITTPPPEARPS